MKQTQILSSTKVLLNYNKYKKGVLTLKTLLTTLNAKFIHSSLALRYLKAYCGDEFDIMIGSIQ